MDTVSINKCRDNLKEQETLYVLQNRDLMQQIATSLETHLRVQGYKPTKEQIDEITGI